MQAGQPLSDRSASFSPCLVSGSLSLSPSFCLSFCLVISFCYLNLSLSLHPSQSFFPFFPLVTLSLFLPLSSLSRTSVAETQSVLPVICVHLLQEIHTARQPQGFLQLLSEIEWAKGKIYS